MLINIVKKKRRKKEHQRTDLLHQPQNVAGSTLAHSTDFTYLYTNQQPNAVKQIGNTSYSYDLNGNPTLVEGDSVYREMIWNEENRLMLLSDDGEVTRYTYDYAGNCAIKSHGPMTSVYINGALQGVDYHDDSDYTLYVSPFMTVNADRFTKYYYAGTHRIAGKIGNGKFENIYGEDGFHLTAGQKGYAQRAVTMLEGLQAYYKQTGVTPGVPNQLGKTADPYVSGTAYPNIALGNYDVPDGWPGKVVKHGKGEVPGPPVWFEEKSEQEAVAGVGYQSDNQEESDIFFYHTDHLQSTTYLTDSVGNISQFVWYTPYGEALIDEHVGSYENPYKFSGKELDENTGLYDHGARHREPSICGWYGVDALFEKYPSCSPYAYCGGNPVRFVDMDGREFTPEAEIWVRRLENEIVRMKEKYDTESSIFREAEATQNEINVLRASEEVYHIQMYYERAYTGQIDSRGRVGYDQGEKDERGQTKGNKLIIFINEYRDGNTEGSDLGAFAHELKHAYQFEMGRLTFMKGDGNGVTTTPGRYYDIFDEEEAHTRGYFFKAGKISFDHTKYGNLNKLPHQINKDQHERNLKKGRDLLKDQIFHFPTH